MVIRGIMQVQFAIILQMTMNILEIIVQTILVKISSLPIYFRKEIYTQIHIVMNRSKINIRLCYQQYILLNKYVVFINFL